MIDDAALAAFARTHAANIAAARSLIADLAGQAGGSRFYIFWVPKGGSGSAGQPRTRTLVAFPSPDAALAFAQRNQLAADRPRLRQLGLVHLLGAVLGEPAIEALLLARESDDPPLAGRLPAGLRITRAEILARLKRSE